MSVASKPQNPITALRESAGLTRLELADALGVSYSLLCHVELGFAGDAPRVWSALNAAGFDGEQIAGEYRNWKAERGRSLRPLMGGRA